MFCSLRPNRPRAQLSITIANLDDAYVAAEANSYAARLATLAGTSNTPWAQYFADIVAADEDWVASISLESATLAAAIANANSDFEIAAIEAADLLLAALAQADSDRAIAIAQAEVDKATADKQAAINQATAGAAERVFPEIDAPSTSGEERRLTAAAVDDFFNLPAADQASNFTGEMFLTQAEEDGGSTTAQRRGGNTLRGRLSNSADQPEYVDPGERIVNGISEYIENPESPTKISRSEFEKITSEKKSVPSSEFDPPLDDVWDVLIEDATSDGYRVYHRYIVLEDDDPQLLDGNAGEHGADEHGACCACNCCCACGASIDETASDETENAEDSKIVFVSKGAPSGRPAPIRPNAPRRGSLPNGPRPRNNPRPWPGEEGWNPKELHYPETFREWEAWNREINRRNINRAQIDLNNQRVRRSWQQREREAPEALRRQIEQARQAGMSYRQIRQIMQEGANSSNARTMTEQYEAAAEALAEQTTLARMADAMANDLQKGVGPRGSTADQRSCIGVGVVRSRDGKQVWFIVSSSNSTTRHNYIRPEVQARIRELERQGVPIRICQYRPVRSPGSNSRHAEDIIIIESQTEYPNHNLVAIGTRHNHCSSCVDLMNAHPNIIQASRSSPRCAPAGLIGPLRPGEERAPRPSDIFD